LTLTVAGDRHCSRSTPYIRHGIAQHDTLTHSHRRQTIFLMQRQTPFQWTHAICDALAPEAARIWNRCISLTYSNSMAQTPCNTSTASRNNAPNFTQPQYLVNAGQVSAVDNENSSGTVCMPSSLTSNCNSPYLGHRDARGATPFSPSTSRRAPSRCRP